MRCSYNIQRSPSPRLCLMDTFRLPSPPPLMKLSIALNSFMFNSVAPVSQCSPQSVHRLSLLSMSWTGTENWISPRLSRRRHGTGTQIFGQYSTYWSVSSSVACPCSQARLYLGGTWNATKYSVKLTIVFIHYFLTARSQVFKPRFFIIFMASPVSEPRNSNYKGLERIKTEKTRKFFDKPRASYPDIHSEIGEGFSPKIFHHVC